MPEPSGGPAVLLTGFEAFGKVEKNPSAEIVGTLDGTSVSGYRVVGTTLPVTAVGAPETLGREIARHEPVLVLMTGLANGRSMPALERVALNVLDFPISDNDGSRPVDEPVAKDGPAAYLATVPVKAILSAWREAGIPGYVSNTAGTFVCNQSFYHALHLSEGRGYRVGLVHVPYLPEQAARADGAPSMSLEVMVRAVELALEVSLKMSLEGSEDIALPAGALS